MALKILVNSLFGGGAEIQAALLAKAMKPEAFLLLDRECSPRPDSPPFSSLFRHGASLPGALKTILSPLYASRLAAITAPGDTVLSFMERSNFVNILSARKSGHRAVICEVTQPSREFSGLRGTLMKPLIKKLYPLADLVISNSKGNARDLADNFDFSCEKIKVIYNSCDTQAIALKAAEPLESLHAAIFKRPVIITSGRLTAAKGHWHLLRIFAELKKTNPGAALVFLGEGELKERLLGLCAALGLKAYFPGGAALSPDAGDVFFLGFQRNPYKFLSKAKIFAFPSLWEGLPNAVLEALACGLPVISSDCRSGPREILAPETDFQTEAAAPEETAFGFLMPPFKAAAPDSTPVISGLEKLWAKNTADLLGDDQRLENYSASCRKRAEAFSLKVKVVEWETALRLKA
ncbi:MAG: glycosyltransferase [Elusimicrobia bacterium]|nr:glycosyltransferase [Elusimicrobiota bacterium]